MRFLFLLTDKSTFSSACICWIIYLIFLLQLNLTDGMFPYLSAYQAIITACNAVIYALLTKLSLMCLESNYKGAHIC